MDYDLFGLKRYVSSPKAITFFDSHRELRRPFSSTFCKQQHMFSAHQPLDESLVMLLSPHASQRRGPIICVAPTKYQPGILLDEDEDKDAIFTVAYDLETTSFGVHVACLRFMAKYVHTGRAYGIETEGVGDGFDLF